jgi:hypothetical protein
MKSDLTKSSALDNFTLGWFSVFSIILTLQYITVYILIHHSSCVKLS